MSVPAIDELIKVDLNTFELTLSPITRNIDVFADIIVRDKGSKGDTQARKKLKAIKEMSYCYLMEKYGTIFFNWQENKRHAEISRRLRISIEDSETFHNDPLILACRNFIRISQVTPSFEALIEIKESYHSSTKMLRVMRKLLEDKIDLLVEVSSMDYDDNDEEGRENVFSLLDKSNLLLSNIKKNVMDFNSVLKLIDDLEEKVKKEQTTMNLIKGGGIASKYEQ